MDTNQIKQNLLKLKDSFLEETEENKKNARYLYKLY